MCDCEELEFEDFELMLAAISKMSRPQTEQANVKAPVTQLAVARQRK